MNARRIWQDLSYLTRDEADDLLLNSPDTPIPPTYPGRPYSSRACILIWVNITVANIRPIAACHTPPTMVALAASYPVPPPCLFSSSSVSFGVTAMSPAVFIAIAIDTTISEISHSCVHCTACSIQPRSFSDPSFPTTDTSVVGILYFVPVVIINVVAIVAVIVVWAGIIPRRYCHLCVQRFFNLPLSPRNNASYYVFVERLLGLAPRRHSYHKDTRKTAEATRGEHTVRP